MTSTTVPVEAPHTVELHTRVVVWLTASTMVVEIGAGWWFNSMALLADGWHMGTHAAAIGLTALAHAATRRLKHDPRFAFGPWKLEVLAAFASAVALLAVAVGMTMASVERLFDPRPIAYQEAIAVAVLGLIVNLVCAWILGPHEHGPGPGPGHGHGHSHGLAHGHDDGHGRGHLRGRDHSTGHAQTQTHASAHAHAQAQAQAQAQEHEHEHHDAAPHGHAPAAGDGHAHAADASQATQATPARTVHNDLNLRSAYLHVIADAATSAVAIAALVGGLCLGYAWLDPAMGVVGAVMVARWGVLLVRDSSRVLLDREMNLPRVRALREAFEQQAPWDGRATLRRLQVWRVGPGRRACTVTLALRDSALGMKQVRQTLAAWPEIVDSAVELEMARPP